MSEISLPDFQKVELRVAKVLDAQEVLGADRIWQLSIDVGTEKKQIVAGVKAFYTKEALIGRSIVVVNNLAPVVIRGVESKGMLLAAKDSGRLCLLAIDGELPPGSIIG